MSGQRCPVTGIFCSCPDWCEEQADRDRKAKKKALVSRENMNPGQTWQSLGTNYPGVDPATMAAFDVLAPIGGAQRSPVYELGKEATPTPDEVWALADELVRAIGLASV